MFRIWLYLGVKEFIANLFSFNKRDSQVKDIKSLLNENSNKKYSAIFSQCRVGFLYILKFLKSRSMRKEVIFCAYNLPEMVNIAHNLELKIKFCDLDYKSGFINLKQVKEKITNNTLAIVLTNMFNNYEDTKKLKDLTEKLNITLIEDNAIYFDNFYLKAKDKKIYSGNFGDYSIYSFNIMKNISSFFGGAVSTNNKGFIDYYDKEIKNLKNFNKFYLFKQVIIFFILKIMSIQILYNIFFSHIIKIAHKLNIKSVLRIFYPSIQNIKINFPRYYYSKISKLSLSLTLHQLKDKSRRIKLFNLRKIKNEYYYEKLSKINTNKLNLIKIHDNNYQNFLDFPILVKDKKKLNDYLLKRGVEVRFKHYYNCQKLFEKNIQCFNAEKYEKELICLPNHPKISMPYIDFIVKNIEVYYSRT